MVRTACVILAICTPIVAAVGADWPAWRVPTGQGLCEENPPEIRSFALLGLQRRAPIAVEPRAVANELINDMKAPEKRRMPAKDVLEYAEEAKVEEGAKGNENGKNRMGARDTIFRQPISRSGFDRFLAREFNAGHSLTSLLRMEGSVEPEHSRYDARLWASKTVFWTSTEGSPIGFVRCPDDLVTSQFNVWSTLTLGHSWQLVAED